MGKSRVPPAPTRVRACCSAASYGWPISFSTLPCICKEWVGDIERWEIISPSFCHGE